MAYNVRKNITAKDMVNWLSQRGVHVRDCKLLTTSSEARTLSYKITLDSTDYERATQDANLWPYGVGVRLFKIFGDKRETIGTGRYNTRLEQQTTRRGLHQTVW